MLDNGLQPEGVEPRARSNRLAGEVSRFCPARAGSPRPGAYSPWVDGRPDKATRAGTLAAPLPPRPDLLIGGVVRSRARLPDQAVARGEHVGCDRSALDLVAVEQLLQDACHDGGWLPAEVVFPETPRRSALAQRV